jgi:hypothetical protein
LSTGAMRAHPEALLGEYRSRLHDGLDGLTE